jgi:hypothetical protein
MGPGRLSDPWVSGLAEIALFSILFSDGMRSGGANGSPPPGSVPKASRPSSTGSSSSRPGSLVVTSSSTLLRLWSLRRSSPTPPPTSWSPVGSNPVPSPVTQRFRRRARPADGFTRPSGWSQLLTRPDAHRRGSWLRSGLGYRPGDLRIVALGGSMKRAPAAARRCRRWPTRFQCQQRRGRRGSRGSWRP